MCVKNNYISAVVDKNGRFEKKFTGVRNIMQDSTVGKLNVNDSQTVNVIESNSSATQA